MYGTILGSVYQEDPVVGIVRFLPTDLSWLKTILMPWVGILAATFGAAVLSALFLARRKRALDQIVAEEDADSDADGIPDVYQREA